MQQPSSLTTGPTLSPMELGPAIEAVLGPVRLYVPEHALLAAFPDYAPEVLSAALVESTRSGRVVRDPRGWLRLNPVFRGRSSREPQVRQRAHVMVTLACEAAPADLSLRVARFALTDWDDPREVTAASTFFKQARFGLRARELVDKLDEADLLPILIQVCPREVLALLLEGGRIEQARPFIGPHDRYLRGLLALQEGQLDDAREWLRDVVGLPARFLRLQVYRAAFDYDAMEAELAAMPVADFDTMDTLRWAFYHHRLLCFRSRWDELDDIIATMWDTTRAIGDGSLQCRVLDSRLAVRIRWGDVPSAQGLLEELERLVGEGWSPGLRSRLSLYSAFVADLAGDHLRLRNALSSPITSPSDDLLRELQQAALHVLEGNAAWALASPAVQNVAGLHAQFLATVGRFGEASARLGSHPPGYSEEDGIILRGPILARLGEGTIHEEWPGITPYQACKLSLSNALTALSIDDLPAALQWADRGIAVATERGLWDLGASLLLTRADARTRSGQPDRAREDLARFDALQRHPSCYLVNQARVARACIDQQCPEQAFFDRLVEQEDHISLAILASRWSVGPAADPLLAQLPEASCDLLEAAFLAPRKRPLLILRHQAREVELPDGTLLDLRRSGAPRRVLLALAERRLEKPGESIDADDLIELGWPGERIHWESARTRLYTVVRRLRARGIEGLETVDGGYCLSRALDVQIGEARPTPADPSPPELRPVGESSVGPEPHIGTAPGTAVGHCVLLTAGPVVPVSTDLEVLQTARQWHEAGHAVVLATVVDTWGSAPRRAGSHLAIRDDQLFVGSVSGGCVEGDVVRNALLVLAEGRGRMVEYGVTHTDAWEVGLACGGRIRVWLEPVA
jgi:hypothetical protein